MFDRGANDKDNLERNELDDNDFLTVKKINFVDDKILQMFDVNFWEPKDEENQVTFYIFSERQKGSL